jgi:MYXO-CTERM domain-containing protein
MTRFRNHVTALFVLNAGLLFAGTAHAGSWQANAPFNASLKGDLYTPTTPAASPAVLVVIHMCTGHSTTVHGWFDKYADAQGFYLIAPDAGKQCFDASASRDGDKKAVVDMVNYVIMNKGADKTRVFAAGMSSGGCMTNTLLAIYPDVFAGGSAMPGFPAGGWPKGDTTCTKCNSSPSTTDGKTWGDMARSAFMWSGTYPCSQQWVGGGDEYNFDGYLPAVAAQWQNLANLGAGTMGTGAPSGWARTVYKDTAGNIRLETNLGPTSQKHDLESVNPPLYGDVVRFLGLDKATGACGLGSSGSGGMSAGGASGSGGMSAGGSPGGGAPGTGGAATGGTAGTSTMNTGGTASGTGGAPGTGGTGVATGGTTMTGSGGTIGTGGTGTGTAGTGVATGGTAPTAGRSGTGGAPTGSGGTGTATGGTTAKGGTGTAGHTSAGTGNKGSGDDDSGESGGCSISNVSSRGSAASLLALGLGALFLRRRRTHG